MTRVYMDVEAAAIVGPAEASLDDAAVRSIEFLAEAGHDVVLVAGNGHEVPAVLRALARDVIPEVPAKPDVAAWYLTTEVERCTGTSARLHTVLIGAAPPTGSIHRCDAVARDVQAAALELLASEAMPGAPANRRST